MQIKWRMHFLHNERCTAIGARNLMMRGPGRLFMQALMNEIVFGFED